MSHRLFGRDKSAEVVNVSYKYEIKYEINWHTRMTVDGETLIVQFRNGKIMADSAINISEITKRITEHLRRNDTTFFAIDADGGLTCHLPLNPNRFRMLLL